jgi:hypothetical protein
MIDGLVSLLGDTAAAISCAPQTASAAYRRFVEGECDCCKRLSCYNCKFNDKNRNCCSDNIDSSDNLLLEANQLIKLARRAKKSESKRAAEIKKLQSLLTSVDDDDDIDADDIKKIIKTFLKEALKK